MKSRKLYTLDTETVEKLSHLSEKFQKSRSEIINTLIKFLPEDQAEVLFAKIDEKIKKTVEEIIASHKLYVWV